MKEGILLCGCSMGRGKREEERSILLVNIGRYTGSDSPGNRDRDKEDGIEGEATRVDLP